MAAKKKPPADSPESTGALAVAIFGDLPRMAPEAAQRRHHDWLTMHGVCPWGRSRCQGAA